MAEYEKKVREISLLVLSVKHNSNHKPQSLRLGLIYLYDNKKATASTKAWLLQLLFNYYVDILI